MPRAGNDACDDKRYDASDDEDVTDLTAAADVGRSRVALPDSPAAELALAAAAYAALECERAERAADELRWLAGHCHARRLAGGSPDRRRRDGIHRERRGGGERTVGVGTVFGIDIAPVIPLNVNAKVTEAVDVGHDDRRHAGPGGGRSGGCGRRHRIGRRA